MNFPTNRLYILLAAAGVLATGVSLSPRSQGQGTVHGTRLICDTRTPINSLPFTIDECGSYFLTRCLTGVSGQNGITIDADDVTLDLNGFSLQGVAGSLDGIGTSGTPKNISIFNGSVTGWIGDGIDLLRAEQITLEGVTCRGNSADGFRLGNQADVSDCQAMGNGGDGFFLSGGPSMVSVASCLSADNFRDGFHAFYVGNPPGTSKGGTITTSVASSNGRGGFYIAGYALKSCSATDNSAGFLLDAVYAEGCRASFNEVGFNAIGGTTLYQCMATRSSNNSYRLTASSLLESTAYATSSTASCVSLTAEATVKGCELRTFLGPNGISIAALSSNNVIDGNIVRGATTYSIYVSPSTSGNTVVRNVIEKDIRNDSGISGNVAPTEDAKTSTNPWANIQL